MQRPISVYVAYIVAGVCVLVMTVGGVAVVIILTGTAQNTTPIFASMIGFAGTIVTALLSLMAGVQAAGKADAVNTKVDGHLTTLTAAVIKSAASGEPVTTQDVIAADNAERAIRSNP